jgi:hypothetical protein
MVRSVQSSPYGFVDYSYYNYILSYVGGCGVVNIGGYVWARYSCLGVHLLYLPLNPHLAEVFNISVGWFPRSTYGYDIVDEEFFVMSVKLGRSH